MSIRGEYIDFETTIALGCTLFLIVTVGGIAWGMLFGIYIPIVRDGEHTGYVTATQADYWGNYNVFLKTELESSQEDRYCVRKDDIELVSQLKNVQTSRERVTLKYMEYLFPKITDCSSQIINGIESVTN